MAERRKGAELGGVADKGVEPGISVEEGRTQFVDLDEIAQVDGDEDGAAAGGANCVIDLLKPADCPRYQDYVGTLAREALGHGCRAKLR